MRRSRSLSNIPLPSKRVSQPKRGISALRTSRDPSLDGHTPLARRLETPTTSSGYKAGWSDQKYRTQKNITPSYSGFKRSASSYGSRGSLTRNRSPLERRSVQKLLNDKKWVAEQYSKVQCFIQSSGLFNPELSKMIRPPTINTVVELFSVLFHQLIKTDPINSQSYADVALRTLKILNYPGTLTLSNLKTANTMHAWPHFISIVSWLIDLVELNFTNDTFKEQQTEELKQMFSLQDSVFDFLTTQHNIHLDEKGIDETLLIHNKQKLKEDMLICTGINLEAVQDLEQPIENMRTEVAELEIQLQDIREEMQKIQAQNLERMELIKKFKESKNTKVEDLEAEISQLKKLRQKQTENKNQLMLSVKELKNMVAQQSGRYDEKAQLLGQIEDLKKAIGRKERKLNEYGALRTELDLELTAMVNEVERKVDAWNVSTTKTLLPELQSLRLREKGFHSEGFIEELREVLREKEQITKQLQEEYKVINLDIETTQKKREDFEKNNKALIATRTKLEGLKSAIKTLKNENRNLISKIEEAKKEFNAIKMEEERLHSIKVKEAETEIADLNDRIQKVTEKFDKSAKTGLAVLQEAHNMTIKTMLTCDGVVQSMLKDATEKTQQSKNNLAETYNCLLSMQEAMLNLTNKCNENNKENLTEK